MKKHATRQRGFSIIELMIAITLSMVITGAALAIYIQTTRGHNEDERYARMEENARYAINMIAEDVQMSQFWGEMLNPTFTSTPTVSPAGSDCNIALFDPTNSILINNNHSGTTVTTFDTSPSACTTVLGAVRAGTDLLAIKRVVGASTTTHTTAAQQAALYLRTNATVGSIVNGSTNPTSPDSDWQYTPRIYYIGNNIDTTGGTIPALCRVSLSGSTFPAYNADNCPAEGIEDLHVQFGIDTDFDGVANYYKSDPTTAELINAVSLRIYVLARSAQTVPGYTNTKKYVLGDVNASETNGTANDGIFNDGYYRVVETTTVSLRNPINMSLLR